MAQENQGIWESFQHIDAGNNSMTVKLVTIANFVNFHKTVFLAKLGFMTWKRSIVQLLFYSDYHGKYHQRRPKMQVLMVFFGLIPFLKSDAVLDHLPESIKVKFVESHDSKKQLLYCLF